MSTDDPGDQVVILRGIRWEQYVALGESVGDAPGVRMTYLDGVLQLMSPCRAHTICRRLVSRLVEVWALERDISLNGFGSETYRKEDQKAGSEPDECYIVGPEKQFPDLAIEVVYSRGGVDKLEVYRRLGVREVWFWIDGGIRVYQLTRNGYRQVRKSRVLAGIDVDEISAIVASTDSSQQTEAVRRYQRSLRRRS